MSEEAPAEVEPTPGPAVEAPVVEVSLVEAPVVEAPAVGAPGIEAPPLIAGNAPFLLTLALVAVGFAYTAAVPDHWLRGVLISAGGFLLGAMLRLLLPDERAGMLAIRAKALDVTCLGAVAVLIVTVGVLLPH